MGCGCAGSPSTLGLGGVWLLLCSLLGLQSSSPGQAEPRLTEHKTATIANLTFSNLKPCESRHRAPTALRVDVFALIAVAPEKSPPLNCAGDVAEAPTRSQVHPINNLNDTRSHGPARGRPTQPPFHPPSVPTRPSIRPPCPPALPSALLGVSTLRPRPRRRNPGGLEDGTGSSHTSAEARGSEIFC